MSMHQKQKKIKQTRENRKRVIQQIYIKFMKIYSLLQIFQNQKHRNYITYSCSDFIQLLIKRETIYNNQSHLVSRSQSMDQQYDSFIIISSDQDIQQMRERAIDNYNSLLKDTVKNSFNIGQFQINIFVAKSLQSGTLAEKENKIRKRIKKFFQYRVDIEDGYFHPRIEPNYNDKQTILIPQSLMLYGVDFLGTKSIKKKFEKYSPEIKWVNDSHCLLKFKNSQSVKEFLNQFAKNKEELKVKIEQDCEEQLLPKYWIELHPPYYELNFQRKLFVRYATTKDDQIQHKQQSKLVGYYQFKQQFEASFLKSFSTKKSEKINMKQNNNKKSKKNRPRGAQFSYKDYEEKQKQRQLQRKQEAIYLDLISDDEI